MTSAATKTVDIGGSNYTLTAKFGTMRLAEGELSGTIPQIMGDVANIGFDVMSSLFWAFLQPKHRMTREGADNLVDIVGFEQVATWVGELLSQYFGKPEYEGNAETAMTPPVTEEPTTRKVKKAG